MATLFMGISVLKFNWAAGVVHQNRDVPWTIA